MGVFLVLIAPERFEPLPEICAYLGWVIVINSRLVLSILVVVIVGEMRDLVGSLDASRCALEAVERLDWEEDWSYGWRARC